MEWQRELGKVMREVRVASGLSQVAVGDRVGYSDRTIARLECHGKLGNADAVSLARLETFQRVFDALGYKLVINLEPK